METILVTGANLGLGLEWVRRRFGALLQVRRGRDAMVGVSATVLKDSPTLAWGYPHPT
jgi:hypothetical protein